ncbi:iron ABC transporter permease [Chitinibacter sp. SCUT-21]|uniref:ABC transporter permease n=1 Tax=Chitinibacter sp. SCUT-21 TaxID=2970891 RepID=UPI0035A637BD
MRFSSLRGVLYAMPIALLTLIPLLVVLGSFLHPQPEVWTHLSEYVLPDVIKNTLILLLGVGVGVLLLGVPLAWFTSVCDFPGRKFFSWALMLPLAMPAYVLAFVQVGLLDFTGPVQTLIRDLTGDSSWFPRIRSTGGVVLVLTLAFYPYVYLLARNAFLTQGKRALEAAQMLGLSRQQGFWQVALPMARPWLIGGLTLALMETLADFGTVAIFNFDTFTTAIYKSWFALFNLPAASQLASLLVLFVLVLVLLEHWARGARQYHGRIVAAERIVLRGWHRYTAVVLCSSVLLIAFIIPMIQLLFWASTIWQEDLDGRYFGFTLRSMMISLLAALIVATLALLLVFIQRRFQGRGTRWLVRIATLGYAVPGSVLAVGVFLPIAWLDNLLIPIAQSMGFATYQILKGSVAVMLLALAARFMAVAFQPIESAMQRISRNQEDAARSLGLNQRQLLWRLHLPLLRGGVLTAVLMCFVDVMKEMPITLMTRPFGWDTLAVRVFEMTSEGMWANAALPSLMIVLTGLIPVILLVLKSEK